MTGLDELKKLNSKLAMLLDDPQPSLIIWLKMLHDVLLELPQYAEEGTLVFFRAKDGYRSNRHPSNLEPV